MLNHSFILRLSLFYFTASCVNTCNPAENNPLILNNKEQQSLKALVAHIIQNGLWSSSDNSGRTFNNTSRFYSRIEPADLTTEELEEQNILKRFKINYIGSIEGQIEEIIGHLHLTKDNPQTYNAPNTILLHGQPGTGKGYLVGHLSKILRIPLLSCSAGSFIDKYAGQSAKNIIEFFSAIKNSDKFLLVFIDEIDAIALKRSRSGSSGEYRAALTTLLIEVQKISSQKNVMLFIATNTLEDLDEAVVSRFQGQMIELKRLTDKQELIAFFRKSLKDNNITSEKELQEKAMILYNRSSGYLWSNRCASRELSKIVGLTLRHIYVQKNIHEKTVSFEQAVRNSFEQIQC